MLLVRSVRGATLHKLHGNISVWSHNFCNTPWIKVGNTTNVKSYLIDRIRPVDLVLLQNLFSACSPPGSYRMRVGFPGGGYDESITTFLWILEDGGLQYVSLSFEQNGSSMVRNLKL